MPAKLNQNEIDALLDKPLHAILATTAGAAPPHVSPVWYLYEDGRLYVSIIAGCAKHRHLERDPRISVCIDGGRDDVRTVMMYGRVELRPDGVDADEMRWRIIRRYYESDAEARRYVETLRDLPHVILRLTPERVVTQDFS